MEERKGWEVSAYSFVQTTLYDAVRIVVKASTRRGKRRSLAWVLPLIQRALVDGITAEDIPKNLAADMLGISPRQYQRIKNASQTKKPTMLYNQVLELLRSGSATVEEIASQLSVQEVSQIRTILRDMDRNNVAIRQSDQTYTLVPPRNRMIDAKTYLRTVRMQGYVDVRQSANETQIPVEQIEILLRELEDEETRCEEKSISEETMWAFFNFTTMGIFQFMMRYIEHGRNPVDRLSGFAGAVPAAIEADFDGDMAHLHASARHVLEEKYQGQFTDGNWRRWLVLSSYGEVVPLLFRKSPITYFDE